jgi:uncharacterized protein (PEP-CTERM system associated)
LLIAAFSHNPMAFSAQFIFTPRASVQEEYTDNVFLTNDNTEDDFITTLSAGFTAELLGRTSGLELSFDPGYVFYQDFTDNNTWRLPAGFRAWTTPSRSTRFEFSDDFLRTEDPIDQDRITTEGGRVEETGDTTVRRNREPYYRNTARFNASHQFGREDRVYAGILYGLLRNDDHQVEDNDEYPPAWITGLARSSAASSLGNIPGVNSAADRTLSVIPPAILTTGMAPSGFWDA